MLVRQRHLVDGVLDALADHEQPALEARRGVRAVEVRAAADEQLLELRGDRGGVPADGPQVGLHRAPAQHGLALFHDDALDQRAQDTAQRLVRGQEHQPGAVGALRRQRKRHGLPEETVRHLHEDARAVTRVGVGAGGAAVFEVDQQVERVPHDGVRADALDMGDEADAAGVVLVR